MRRRLGVHVLAVAAATCLLGAPAASARGVSPSIVQAAVFVGKLHGSTAYPAIRGNAEYTETLESSPDLTFYLSLRHAGRLAGHRLTVYLAGQFVGRMRVGRRGRTHLAVGTANGQYLPELRADGKLGMRVRTRSGALVARGKLHFVPPPA